MIKFVEIIENGIDSYVLREVWINETHVVSIQETHEYKRLLEEGFLPGDLDRSHDFTSVILNAGPTSKRHVVVGDVGTVARKFNYDSRTLLKG
jgi:hypothetical protein